MTEISARGFAVVMDGKIDMRTVYPHVRGAIVNWLGTTGGVTVTNHTSDNHIFALWDQRRGDAQVQAVKVTVVPSAAE